MSASYLWILFALLAATVYAGEINLKIDRKYSGEPILGGDHVSITLRGNDDERDVQVLIDAPYLDDPAPLGRSGEAFMGLWNYEVVEMFFLNDKGQYLEVEVGPHGHHLVLLMDAAQPGALRHSLPLDVQSEITADGRWMADVLIPGDYFPEEVTKVNVFAINGLKKSKQYWALNPELGSFRYPDVHDVNRFLPIDMTAISRQHGPGYDSILWIGAMRGFQPYAIKAEIGPTAEEGSLLRAETYSVTLLEFSISGYQKGVDINVTIAPTSPTGLPYQESYFIFENEINEKAVVVMGGGDLCSAHLKNADNNVLSSLSCCYFSQTMGKKIRASAFIRADQFPIKVTKFSAYLTYGKEGQTRVTYHLNSPVQIMTTGSDDKTIRSKSLTIDAEFFLEDKQVYSQTWAEALGLPIENSWGRSNVNCKAEPSTADKQNQDDDLATRDTSANVDTVPEEPLTQQKIVGETASVTLNEQTGANLDVNEEILEPVHQKTLDNKPVQVKLDSILIQPEGEKIIEEASLKADAETTEVKPEEPIMSKGEEMSVKYDTEITNPEPVEPSILVEEVQIAANPEELETNIGEPVQDQETSEVQSFETKPDQSLKEPTAGELPHPPFSIILVEDGPPITSDDRPLRQEPASNIDVDVQKEIEQSKISEKQEVSTGDELQESIPEIVDHNLALKEESPVNPESEIPLTQQEEISGSDPVLDELVSDIKKEVMQNQQTDINSPEVKLNENLEEEEGALKPSSQLNSEVTVAKKDVPPQENIEPLNEPIEQEEPALSQSPEKEPMQKKPMVINEEEEKTSPLLDHQPVEFIIQEEDAPDVHISLNEQPLLRADVVGQNEEIQIEDPEHEFQVPKTSGAQKENSDTSVSLNEGSQDISQTDDSILQQVDLNQPINVDSDAKDTVASQDSTNVQPQDLSAAQDGEKPMPSPLNKEVMADPQAIQLEETQVNVDENLKEDEPELNAQEGIEHSPIIQSLEVEEQTLNERTGELVGSPVKEETEGTQVSDDNLTKLEQIQKGDSNLGEPLMDSKIIGTSDTVQKQVLEVQSSEGESQDTAQQVAEATPVSLNQGSPQDIKPDVQLTPQEETQSDIDENLNIKPIENIENTGSESNIPDTPDTKLKETLEVEKEPEVIVIQEVASLNPPSQDEGVQIKVVAEPILSEDILPIKIDDQKEINVDQQKPESQASLHKLEDTPIIQVVIAEKDLPVAQIDEEAEVHVEAVDSLTRLEDPIENVEIEEQGEGVQVEEEQEEISSLREVGQETPMQEPMEVAQIIDENVDVQIKQVNQDETVDVKEDEVKADIHTDIEVPASPVKEDAIENPEVIKLEFSVQNLDGFDANSLPKDENILKENPQVDINGESVKPEQDATIDQEIDPPIEDSKTDIGVQQIFLSDEEISNIERIANEEEVVLSETIPENTKVENNEPLASVNIDEAGINAGNVELSLDDFDEVGTDQEPALRDNIQTDNSDSTFEEESSVLTNPEDNQQEQSLGLKNDNLELSADTIEDTANQDEIDIQQQIQTFLRQEEIGEDEASDVNPERIVVDQQALEKQKIESGSKGVIEDPQQEEPAPVEKEVVSIIHVPANGELAGINVFDGHIRNQEEEVAISEQEGEVQIEENQFVEDQPQEELQLTITHDDGFVEPADNINPPIEQDEEITQVNPPANRGINTKRIVQGEGPFTEPLINLLAKAKATLRRRITTRKPAPRGINTRRRPSLQQLLRPSQNIPTQPNHRAIHTFRPSIQEVSVPSLVLLEENISSMPLPPPHPICFREGLVPDDLRCQVFYECVLENNEWQMYSWRCKRGHKFDPDLVACVRGFCGM